MLREIIDLQSPLPFNFIFLISSLCSFFGRHRVQCPLCNSSLHSAIVHQYCKVISNIACGSLPSSDCAMTRPHRSTGLYGFYATLFYDLPCNYSHVQRCNMTFKLAVCFYLVKHDALNCIYITE